MTKSVTSELLVVCLCAEWCGVCREYRGAFEALAHQRPDAAFRWIDVESDGDYVGDLDVENFPTILIQHGETVLFFGTMPPQVAHLQRTLGVLGALTPAQAQTHAAAHATDEAWQLAGRLGKAVLARIHNDA